MQRLNHNIADREAGTRINRVLGMVSEAATFPVVLRFYLRQSAIGRRAKMLVEHLEMLHQHLTAGITVMAMAMSGRRGCEPCPVRIRQEQANPRPTLRNPRLTPLSAPVFERRG